MYGSSCASVPMPWPDAVHEVLAEARAAAITRRDAASTSSHGVPTVAAAHAGLLRVDEHRVDVADLGGGSPTWNMRVMSEQ